MDNRYKKIREDFEFKPNGKRLTTKELSAIFISKGYDALTDGAIRKIENNFRNVYPHELKAYCEVFDTTSDYLLGIVDESSSNIEVLELYKKLGLSSESITKIESMSKEQQKVLDMLVKHEDFEEFIVKTQNFLHSANMGIIVQDTIKKPSQNRDECYSVNGKLQANTDEIHRFLITNTLNKILVDIFEPYRLLGDHLFLEDCIHNLFYSALLISDYLEDEDEYYSEVEFITSQKKDALIYYEQIQITDCNHKILKYSLDDILLKPRPIWKELYGEELPEDIDDFPGFDYDKYTYYDL